MVYNPSFVFNLLIMAKRVIEIGVCSPPFGMNLFGLIGIIKTPITDLYRGVLPFLVADIVNLGLLIAFPPLATFLPELMVK